MKIQQTRPMWMMTKEDGPSALKKKKRISEIYNLKNKQHLWLPELYSEKYGSTFTVWP